MSSARQPPSSVSHIPASQARPRCWYGRDLRRSGPHAHDPGGQIGKRAFRDHGHHLAVDLRRTRQHGAERLRRPHPGARRAAQPVQQRRVEDHPAAPQLDQWPFGLSQGGDLAGVEQRAAEGELPAEVQQRREPEPGVRQLLRRRRGYGSQFQAVAEHAGWPQHLDAGARQFFGGGAEQAGQRVVVEVDCRRAGLSQRFGQRRPYRRTAPQRQQHVRLRLRAEPGQHGLGLAPQRGSVDDQARIGVAAQLQYQPERRLGTIRRGIVLLARDVDGVRGRRRDSLDPQPETRTSRQAVGGVGEPVREIADRHWAGRGKRGRRGGQGGRGRSHDQVGDRVPELADQ
jgi:hypothetical protein